MLINIQEHMLKCLRKRYFDHESKKKKSYYSPSWKGLVSKRNTNNF